MPLPNPTINPPRIAPPGLQNPQSRSPSQSPVRHARNFSHDPVLRNLSPSSTYRAFTAGPSTTVGNSEYDLVKSIEGASSADRAFGVRVAQTCKDLKSWAVEVESWEWPGTFEPPPVEERAERRQYMLEEYGVVPKNGTLTPGEDGGFWGSLPKEVVQNYEARIDDIAAAMEELDVETLKDYVRKAHAQPQSPYKSKQAERVPSKLKRVDDFTAIVTATILQALPYISWLNRLLSEWSARLTMMRKVPGFLRGLGNVKLDLDRAWDRLLVESQRSEEVAGPLQRRFEAMRAGLGAKVSALGQRLDSMLDELEGRPETLPEGWIDKFEDLEAAYSNWVVQSERIVMGLVWEQSKSRPKQKTKNSTHHGLGIGSASSNTLSRQESSSSQPLVSPIGERDAFFEVATPPGEDGRVSPERRTESPILGNSPYMRDRKESMVISDESIPRSEDSGRPRQNSSFVRLVDDVILEAQDQAHMTVDSNDRRGTSHQRRKSTPCGYPTLPVKTVVEAPQLQPSPRVSPSKGSFSTSTGSASPRSRSRHVPIDVNGHQRAASSPVRLSESNDTPFAINQEPPLPDVSEEISRNNMQARKALFSGDLEKTQFLAKPTKTPVRPFEHASSAFTKLFAAANARNHSRNNSGSSRTSSLRKAMAPAKPDARNIASSKRDSSNTNEELATTGHRLSKSSVGTANGSIERTNSQQSTGANLRSATGQYQAVETERNSGSTQPFSGTQVRSITGGDHPRFDSPFLPQEQYADWPLPANDTAVGEEITSPNKAFTSDYFESLFVDTLPASPAKSPEAEAEAEAESTQKPLAMSRRPSSRREPSLDSSMIDGVFNRTMDEMKAAKPKRASRHRSGSVRNSDQFRQFSTAIPEVDTPGGTGPSATSTPEIRDASMAGYFQATAVRTPPPARKISPELSRSSDDERRKSEGAEFLRKAEIFELPAELPSTGVIERQDADNSQKEQQVKVERRASVASMELLTRGQARTVEIPRTLSTSSTGSNGEQPYQTTQDARADPRLAQRRSEPSSPVFDRPPGSLPARSNSTREHLGVPARPLRTDSERSMIAYTLGAPKPLPLDLQVSKRRQPVQTDGQVSPILDTVAEKPKTPAKSEKRRDSIPSNAGDNIDRHVSDVLQRLPSGIKFHTRPTKTLTQRPGSPEGKNGRTTPGPKSTAASRLVAQGLTLAPASTGDSSPRRGTDPTAKLYHLSAPGKNEPIKLFIRLVGENERVMVRVGGGWMDLAEYLKQYAEHHGHRTVSGSQIQVHEGSSKINSTGKTRTPLSRPGSTLDTYAASPTTRRPESAMSTQNGDAKAAESNAVGSKPADVRPGDVRQGDVRPGELKTPEMLSSPFVGANSPWNASSPNYTYGQSGTNTSTPRTDLSAHASRPSTSGSGGGVDHSRPTSADAVGLSGRKVGDLDENKRMWVEDMMSRATKQASAEKREKNKPLPLNRDGKGWDNLGKAGGTQRLVYRAD